MEWNARSWCKNCEPFPTHLKMEDPKDIAVSCAAVRICIFCAVELLYYLRAHAHVNLIVLGPGVSHLLIAANSISSARRRKQRRAVPELHPSSSSSYTYSALVTMVFDGCAPLVWRWNGYVPWPKSSPHNTLKMSEVFNNQFELLKMLTIKVPGNT